MGDRILVVDDEPDMRMLLRMTLERSGFDVQEAATGEEAVELAGDANIGLVLLDVNLPGIDGLEAVAAIREGGRTELPVILLTAASDSSLPERAVAHGCHDVISKYVPSAELIATIKDALDPETTS